ncbi:hypothetical protein QBC38DRAFT_427227 [Podospora fimiseda]|uniref:Uncharacterized protein n=1 Tax=Podospora fimiseda TaxID=252190 RepID=A0AAN7BG66_9PEZI|nr:hypothetical protein QBC38DRAFT_427227 [Podospora fimiseda]
MASFTLPHWLRHTRIILPSFALIVFLLIFYFSAHSGHLEKISSLACSFYPSSASDQSFLGTELLQFAAPHKNGSIDHHTLLAEAHNIPHGGFLRVREPDGREVAPYGISMYHQLHCVEMLRSYITGVPHGNHQHHGRHEHHDEKPQVMDKLDEPHMIHCLDYLAQAIVCAADDTIEPFRLKKVGNNTFVSIVDGSDTLHHCRNSKAIFDIVKSAGANPIHLKQRLGEGETVTSLHELNS